MALQSAVEAVAVSVLMTELQWAKITGLQENGKGIVFSPIKMINQRIMTRIKCLTH